MKTLYVSDLDGTLLHSNEKTSKYTNDIINDLVEKGMIFSYATARSYVTSQKVTKGLTAKIPLIVYNGSMIYLKTMCFRLYIPSFVIKRNSLIFRRNARRE